MPIPSILYLLGWASGGPLVIAGKPTGGHVEADRAGSIGRISEGDALGLGSGGRSVRRTSAGYVDRIDTGGAT